jgi:formylmethanofuran dehydrogenase subunit E
MDTFMGSKQIKSSFRPPSEASVRCRRCSEMMVNERFYGREERFLGWRCVACGEIIDETILENRQKPEGKVGQKGEKRKAE